MASIKSIFFLLIFILPHKKKRNLQHDENVIDKESAKGALIVFLCILILANWSFKGSRS